MPLLYQEYGIVGVISDNVMPLIVESLSLGDQRQSWREEKHHKISDAQQKTKSGKLCLQNNICRTSHKTNRQYEVVS